MIISSFFFSTLCFSQQQIINVTQTNSSVSIQNSSSASPRAEKEIGANSNLVSDMNSRIGTMAVEAEPSSINKIGDLNSPKTRAGEKALEPRSSEISHDADPSLTNTHIGKRVHPN